MYWKWVLDAPHVAITVLHLVPFRYSVLLFLLQLFLFKATSLILVCSSSFFTSDPISLTLPRYHLIADSTSFNGYDRHVMANAKLVDASSHPTSTAVFELEITDNYANLNNVMHGGAAGVIFDMCTTSALGPVARPGFWE